MQTKNGANRY